MSAPYHSPSVWMKVNKDTIDNLKGFLFSRTSTSRLARARTCARERAVECVYKPRRGTRLQTYMSESLLPSPSLHCRLHCRESTSKEEVFWSEHRMWAGGNTESRSRTIWQTERRISLLLYCNFHCFHLHWNNTILGAWLCWHRQLFKLMQSWTTLIKRLPKSHCKSDESARQWAAAFILNVGGNNEKTVHKFKTAASVLFISAALSLLYQSSALCRWLGCWFKHGSKSLSTCFLLRQLHLHSTTTVSSNRVVYSYHGRIESRLA